MRCRASLTRAGEGAALAKLTAKLSGQPQKRGPRPAAPGRLRGEASAQSCGRKDKKEARLSEALPAMRAWCAAAPGPSPLGRKPCTAGYMVAT